MCVVCMCVDICVCGVEVRVQSDEVSSFLSVWVLTIKLKLSGLAASALSLVSVPFLGFLSGCYAQSCPMCAHWN